MPRKAFKPPLKRPLDLRLYVAGSGTRSLRAIDNVKRKCEERAPGEYHLSIVDIYQNPDAAVEAQIVAVPTLVRRFPAPKRMYVGDGQAFDPGFSWLSER